jgi:branched-chain amino acid transport system permease protein
MIEQLALNGVISAGIYCLVGISFALIYRTAQFFHFAHGIVFTSGAYLSLFFSVIVRLPLIPSTVLAVLLSAFLGCLIEGCVYHPLRRKGSSATTLLLASLGVYIVLQNVISLGYGDEARSIVSGRVQEGYLVGGARITGIQIVIISVAGLLVLMLQVLLNKTKAGTAMRAVANDPELSRILGIDNERVIVSAFALGSAIAGFAGVLVGLDVGMTPTMGMNALLMGVVSVVIGGRDWVFGVMLGALLMGLMQHVGVWKLNAQWQDAIVFVVLLIFLVFRPHGFVGRPLRKETV